MGAAGQMGHAINRGGTRNAGSSRRPHLFTDRSGNGVPIVTTEENDWALECRGEVECAVKVALTGRAVTEEADRARVALLHLERIRRSGRLRQLGSQRRGNRMEVEC